MSDKSTKEWVDSLNKTLDQITKNNSEQSLINSAVAVSDTLKILLREDLIKNSTYEKIIENFIDTVYNYKKINGMIK
uniref:hypothetical protein n=1 Tax=Polynucleobacter sp. TaxID=2029855 RepID=UPI00404861F7